jgi:biotin carboxylase
MAHLALVVPKESYRADAFLEAARRRGHRLTIVTDARTPAAASVLEVDSLDPNERTPRLADELAGRQVDAVIGVDESSVRLAAALSDALGLSTGRLEATVRATDKRLLREALAAAELPQPRFVTRPLATWAAMAPGDRAALLDELGGDLVAKPTRCSASRGVIRTSPTALPEALSLLEDVVAPEAEVQIEQYVPGEEYAVEGILAGERLEILVIFAKPGHGAGPYFWESIYLGPAPIDETLATSLHATLERAARALALRDTPIHAEVRIHDGLVTILELAPRTIGGRCAAAITFSNGQRLEDLVLARALGDRSPARITHRAIGILMLETPSDGVLVGFEGVEAVTRLPWIQGVELTATPGQHLLAPPRSERYPGFVFAAGPSRRLVSGSLEEARRLLKVVVRAPG